MNKINNYSSIEEYVEEVLIPNYVKLKQKKNATTGEIEYYPSIQLSFIKNLKISEEEQKRVINYLGEQNIRVGGMDPELDEKYDNYDYFRTFKSIVLPENLDPADSLAKFKLYKLTKDPIIREQLIMGNMRLVPYTSWKFQEMCDIEIEELNQFGYLGLMKAVDEFDYTKGVQFATYAIKCIKYSIMNGIDRDERLKGTTLSLLINIKRSEKENGRTIQEYPEDLDEIIDNMIEEGKIKREDKEKVKKNFLFINPISLDTLEEETVDNLESISGYVDNNSENIVIEEMSNNIIKDAIETLSDREQQIVRIRFGFDNGEPKTLAETAKIMGVTSDIIRYTEMRALRKLRNPRTYKDLLTVAYDDYIPNKPKSK